MPDKTYSLHHLYNTSFGLLRILCIIDTMYSVSPSVCKQCCWHLLESSV